MSMREIDRAFYEEYGAPATRAAFPDAADRIAAGVVGAGSECFGYDDDISRDHDCEVGFRLWVTDADYDAFGFALSTVYDRLPKTFRGIPTERRSRMGDGRHGVHRISDFYRQFTGTDGAPETWQQWLQLPS